MSQYGIFFFLSAAFRHVHMYQPNPFYLSFQCSFKGTGLLSSIRSNKVHQHRRKTIIRLEPNLVQLIPNLAYLRRVEALLDDTGHESGELGLLPALLGAELGVDEIEALEGVVDLDAAVQVGAAAGAGVALDRGLGVHDAELRLVGRDRQVVPRHDADDAEERACGLPALGAAAGVVVGDVGA